MWHDVDGGLARCRLGGYRSGLGADTRCRSRDFRAATLLPGGSTRLRPHHQRRRAYRSTTLRARHRRFGTRRVSSLFVEPSIRAHLVACRGMSLAAEGLTCLALCFPCADALRFSRMQMSARQSGVSGRSGRRQQVLARRLRWNCARSEASDVMSPISARTRAGTAARRDGLRHSTRLVSRPMTGGHNRPVAAE